MGTHADDGTLLTFGNGERGQLGHSTMDNLCTPRAVEHLDRYVHRQILQAMMFFFMIQCRPHGTTVRELCRLLAVLGTLRLSLKADMSSRGDVGDTDSWALILRIGTTVPTRNLLQPLLRSECLTSLQGGRFLLPSQVRVSFLASIVFFQHS